MGRQRVGRGRIAASVAAAAAATSVWAGTSGAAPSSAASSAAAPRTSHVAGFTAGTANEEAYWYSRYSMMTLTMQSGLGTTIPMTPDLMAMMQQMMAAAGPAAGDPVMAPMNPRLLLTIYAGGDPHYVTPPTQADFATLAWKGGPARLTTESTATTIAKELEWAKLFHRAGHFGQAGVDGFGSTQRFVGELLAAMAKMQMKTYLADPATYASSRAGDYALLMALSDGAGLYSSADQNNDQGPDAGPATYPSANRYLDPGAAAMFADAARSTFERVLVSRPRSTRDVSLAIQSVVWYSSITASAAERDAARAAIIRWGDRLALQHPATPAGRAYQVRGLIEVGRTLGTGPYLDRAADAFRDLVRGFDARHGVLAGTGTLTIDDVAEISGAFNSAQLFLGTRIDQPAAGTVFAAWWEGSVNRSGLEIASPALDQMKAPFELLDPPGTGTAPAPALNYRYPSVPLPENAGGADGVAPVFAASVRWRSGHWTARHDWFDVAGAMHAANEMIWFHGDEINGFPDGHLKR